MAYQKSVSNKQDSVNYLNAHVKKMLDDIIDVAYCNEPEENRKNYKDFTIDITSRELLSKSGHYIIKERKIEIFNLSLGSEVTVKVSIHELAHHIDQCKNGSTGHKVPFYKEFKTLLYAALNMQLFTPGDVKLDTFHNDSNKVAKIVEEWVPNYVNYRKDSIVFYVKSSYYTKTLLQKNGYMWDDSQRLWKKEVFIAEKENEITFLNSIHAEYDISEATSMHIQNVCYINAVATKIAEFEELKRQGFTFQRTNTRTVWKKKMDAKESNREIERLKSIDALKKVNFFI